MSRNKARDMAAGPAETDDDPSLDRIGFQVDHDQRNCRAALQGSLDPGGTQAVDHIYLQADQIGNEPREAIILSLGISTLEHEILSLYVPHGAQPFAERLKELGSFNPARAGRHRPDSINLPP